MDWLLQKLTLPSREVLESRMYLIPLFPLVGFLLNGVFGKRFHKTVAGLVGTLAAFAAFITAFMCVHAVQEVAGGRTALHASYGTWLATPDFTCSFGFTSTGSRR